VSAQRSRREESPPHQQGSFWLWAGREGAGGVPVWVLLAGGTALLLALFYERVLLGGEVYDQGDVARVYLPQRAALARALRAGMLPWWAPELGIGYPLLAEGQVGALYPINWALPLLLSPVAGVTAAVILHYLVAGAGMYAYARGLGLSRAAAYWAGMVLALGGFYVAHLSHLSILSVAAWIPWSLAFGQRILTTAEGRARPPWGAAAGLAGAVACQLLAGHAQMALLGLIVLAAQGAWLGWAGRGTARLARRGVLWGAALAVGLAVSASQWLAGAQLTALSQRSGGVDSAFFTSYSFHPLLLVTYVFPFVLGNPYPEGSVELMPYLGVLPLALAGLALCRQGRGRWPLALLGLAGVFLALGRWNPLYGLLRHVPVLNLFRVPARYLSWTSLALALLSAMGLDDVLHMPRARSTTEPGRWAAVAPWGAALVAVALGAWVAAQGRDAGALVRLWGWLPVILIAASVAWLVLARRMTPGSRLVTALALLVVDLYAYGAVLGATYSATTPRTVAEGEPASLAFLEQDGRYAQNGLYRIYTKEEITPALSVMRESYFPNMALTHGLSGANLYLPLMPRAYGDYLEGLTPERLNRLNVRYYLIPQLLPVDEASELYDVQNPLAALPADRWIDVPPMRPREIVIESYLSHSVDLSDGALAAEVVLRDAEGGETVLPLRAGIETAEWAYERDDVAGVVGHAMPPVASTWPSRSGFPPREHRGHTYLACWAWDSAQEVVAVSIRPVLPLAYVRVERVRLYDDAGSEHLLSHLMGLGDHTIAYRSEDVLIYRNEDALPRAYTLPWSAVRAEGDGVALPERVTTADVGPADVVAYGPQEVILEATVEEPALLVLADMAYPGWRATIDGTPAPILTVDGVFRGLVLRPGAHRVRFTYRPAPLERVQAQR
jgi:hypothetical protein